MIQIANPSFDAVFKFLMADFKAARILLSALLGEEIEILELLPQERPLTVEGKPAEGCDVQTIQSVIPKISVVRFDYCATLNIKGEKKKVLIELQKGKNELDVARFRRYLGSHYDTKERLQGIKEVLPIIAIYLFGFNMVGVEPAITRFHPAGTDLIEDLPFTHGNNEIIDRLTHTSYFVQLSKLPTKSKNRVSKILSVFSQNWVREKDTKTLYLPDELIEDSSIKVLVDRLHHALLDIETQRQLVEEDEYQKTIERNMEEREALGRAQGFQQGMQQGIQQGIEQGMQQGIEQGKKEQALETAKNLKALKLSALQIAHVTGLSVVEIEEL